MSSVSSHAPGYTVPALPPDGEAKRGRIGTGSPGPDLNIPHRPDLTSVVERFAGEGIHVVAYD